MLKQVINKIKQSKNQEDSFVWCCVLVRELQKKHYNLAVQWASNCIQSYLLEFKPSRFIELNNYVRQALESQKVLTASQYNEIALKIWNLSNRNDAQCAVSLLWWAIAEFKLGEDECGMRELGAAVEVIRKN